MSREEVAEVYRKQKEVHINFTADPNRRDFSTENHQNFGKPEGNPSHENFRSKFQKANVPLDMNERTPMRTQSQISQETHVALTPQQLADKQRSVTEMKESMRQHNYKMGSVIGEHNRIALQIG